MINSLKNIIGKKYVHIAIIIIIVFILLFILGIIVLRYNVEGETNMPFELTKITVVSSSEGIDIESPDTKWAFDVYQSNDIYLYIDKNDKYKETKAIENITVDNINIESERKDKIKIYRPDANETNPLFKNVEENIVDSITYEGSMESIFKQLRISNQGGLIAFRCSNDNLIKYTSNDEEINHYELLKKAGIKQEDLKAKITFDLTIKIKEGNSYKSTINLDLPIDNVIEQGATSKEITELKDVIFKRINN